MTKRIWITWENQRRSIELSKKMGCKLFLIEREGVFRYPLSLVQTVFVILKERPNLVVVQNPSMILAAVACIYGSIANIYTIVDRHSTFRLNKPHTGSFRIWLFMRLHYFTLRNADLTIVTNDYLAQLVEKAGGRSFVLPDCIPSLKKTDDVDLKGRKKLMLVSSFGQDEPIEEVVEAMKAFEKEGVMLYVTGNYKKKDLNLPDKVPSNVLFTGFIPERDYVNLLFSVDAAMALTTSDYCMLCGCYEVVSAEKPLITSDKGVLRDYFKGAVFVENNSADIERGIRVALEQSRVDRSKKMKKNLEVSWAERHCGLEAFLKRRTGL